MPWSCTEMTTSCGGAPLRICRLIKPPARVLHCVNSELCRGNANSVEVSPANVEPLGYFACNTDVLAPSFRLCLQSRHECIAETSQRKDFRLQQWLHTTRCYRSQAIFADACNLIGPMFQLIQEFHESLVLRVQSFSKHPGRHGNEGGRVVDSM